MSEIEIYQRYPEPVSYQKTSVRLNDNDFSGNLTETDIKNIDAEWQRVLQQNPEAFSTPGDLATLRDTRGGILSFDTTDFKTYVAVSRTSEQRILSPKIYDTMRVAAVGAALYLEDDSVFIHRRSKNATHVPNAWDSSVAGFVQPQDGQIDFSHALYNKLQRELQFTEDEIEASRIVVTGIHSSRAPDFSGTMNFVIHTPLERATIERKVEGQGQFEEYAIVPQRELPSFILSNYTGDQDVCLDGCATLLFSLPSRMYQETLQSLKRKGRRIRHGRLEQGVFVQDK